MLHLYYNFLCLYCYLGMHFVKKEISLLWKNENKKSKISTHKKIELNLHFIFQIKLDLNKLPTLKRVQTLKQKPTNRNCSDFIQRKLKGWKKWQDYGERINC